jgi:hypothetical protein
MNIEDNVGDSTLQRMWKAGHIIVDTTNTKIENGLKKYGLDKIPASIEEIRRQNDKIHANTSEAVGFLSALFSGLGQAVAERKAKKGK